MAQDLDRASFMSVLHANRTRAGLPCDCDECRADGSALPPTPDRLSEIKGRIAGDGPYTYNNRPGDDIRWLVAEVERAYGRIAYLEQLEEVAETLTRQVERLRGSPASPPAPPTDTEDLARKMLHEAQRLLSIDRVEVDGGRDWEDRIVGWPILAASFHLMLRAALGASPPAEPTPDEQRKKAEANIAAITTGDDMRRWDALWAVAQNTPGSLRATLRGILAGKSVEEMLSPGGSGGAATPTQEGK